MSEPLNYDKQRYDELEREKEQLGIFMDTSEYKDSRSLQRETLEKFCTLCEEQQQINPYPYIKRQKYLLIKKTLKSAKKTDKLVAEGLLDIHKAQNKIKSIIEKTFKQKTKKGGFRR